MMNRARNGRRMGPIALINFVSQSCDYYCAFLSPFGNLSVESAGKSRYCVACRLRISAIKETPVLCAFLRTVKLPAGVELIG